MTRFANVLLNRPHRARAYGGLYAAVRDPRTGEVVRSVSQFILAPHKTDSLNGLEAGALMATNSLFSRVLTRDAAPLNGARAPRPPVPNARSTVLASRRRVQDPGLTLSAQGCV
jgi:hypothetical protein